MTQDFFVGIDISKATLDVAILPGDQPWSLANDEQGLQPSKVALVGAMRKLLTILNAIARDGEPWATAEVSA